MPARVLRVVGALRSEARVVVEALAPVGEVRGFEELAMEIFPSIGQSFVTCGCNVP